MKSIRWTEHALTNLVEREIDREDAAEALCDLELVVPDPPDREIHMRRYFDSVLEKEMLLRVVTESSEGETVVVTIYKTSQIGRYIPGARP